MVGVRERADNAEVVQECRGEDGVPAEPAQAVQEPDPAGLAARAAGAAAQGPPPPAIWHMAVSLSTRFHTQTSRLIITRHRFASHHAKKKHSHNPPEQAVL